ncbi:MAG: restriction endonuclease subunit S [Pseudomonadota bacterium]|nr:restriction endonuclease subunit S [Pseudomonadota bacterium]
MVVRAPVGDVNMAKEKCCIGRGVAAIRHKTGSASYTYYSMLKLKEYFNLFESEGTVFGSIGKKDFESLEVVLPSHEFVKAFEDYAGPLDKKIGINSEQIITLASIRDILLQMLISGENQIIL